MVNITLQYWRTLMKSSSRIVGEELSSQLSKEDEEKSIDLDEIRNLLGWPRA
jgi:hypothetical protein